MAGIAVRVHGPPTGLAQPLEFVRVYAVETKQARRYLGTLAFDDLTSWSERTAPVAVTAPLRDPLVADLAPLGDGGLRVAVISDAGIRAAAPGSSRVARTRRMMREIVAAKPGLVLINGALVGKGEAADLAFARSLIQEELARKVPWQYVPGDREVGQSGDLTNFRAEFGSPVRTLDQDGTRFVLLNSARGTFRLGGFAQLLRLRSELRTASDDPSVKSVVVAAHHPTSDPNAGGTAELTDPREGELVESMLAEFRSDTGKNAAYVGSHARRFGVTRHDKVPLVVAGPVDDLARAVTGSFSGWTMLRVDATADAWLRAEFRPMVDALQINAPATLPVGSVAEVSAAVTQAGRVRPVSYPMGALWVSSQTLHIGPAGGAPSSAVAAYNPETGKLTGIRAGQTTLVLSVNGKTASRALTVT